MIVLGLDVSTTRTGYCLLDMGHNVVRIGDIITTKTKKRVSHYDRVEHLREKLVKSLKGEQIDAIWVEEPLSRLGRGQSSSQTISLLARFNGMVSYLVWKEFGLEPNLCKSQVARSAAGITIPRGKKRPRINGEPKSAKLYVAERVAALDPGIEIAYTDDTKTSLSAGVDDRLDAYVIARYGVDELRKQIRKGEASN